MSTVQAPKATKFEITGNFGRAQTGVIELAIEEALDALIGFEARAIAVQTNDKTIEITVVPARVRLSL